MSKAGKVSQGQDPSEQGPAGLHGSLHRSLLRALALAGSPGGTSLLKGKVHSRRPGPSQPSLKQSEEKREKKARKREPARSLPSEFIFKRRGKMKSHLVCKTMQAQDAGAGPGDLWNQPRAGEPGWGRGAQSWLQARLHRCGCPSVLS